MIQELLQLKPRLNCLDFSTFFKTVIEEKILADCKKYCVLEKFDMTTKRLFYHHIIHEITELLLISDYRNKIVFFFNEEDLDDLKLSDIYSDSKVKGLIQSVILKIRNYLPINIHFSKLHFSQFKRLFIAKDRLSLDEITLMSELVNRDKTYFTFFKIKNFTVKYGLNFLTAEYFNNLKAKILLVS